MITAKDLRIGNIVYLVDEESDTPITFHVVGKHSFDLIEFMEPIPLSEDILVKAGFVKGEFSNSSQSDEYAQSYVNYYPSLQKATYYGEVVKGQVKFVHQLQNLYFALTNEELTPCPTIPVTK